MKFYRVFVVFNLKPKNFNHPIIICSQNHLPISVETNKSQLPRGKITRLHNVMNEVVHFANQKRSGPFLGLYNMAQDQLFVWITHHGWTLKASFVWDMWK